MEPRCVRGDLGWVIVDSDDNPLGPPYDSQIEAWHRFALVTYGQFQNLLERCGELREIIE